MDAAGDWLPPRLPPEEGVLELPLPGEDVLLDDVLLFEELLLVLEFVVLFVSFSFVEVDEDELLLLLTLLFCSWD